MEKCPVTSLIQQREHAQLCPTLCDSVDCSPPGSSVHGISQARILEWVAVSFSRGSSQTRDQTGVSIAGRFFTIRATWAGQGFPFKYTLLFFFLFIGISGNPTGGTDPLQKDRRAQTLPRRQGELTR